MRRRGQNLVVLNACMSLVGLVAFPVVLSQPQIRSSLPLIVVVVLIFGAGAVLARMGRVTLAAWLLVGMWLLAIVGTYISTGIVNVTPVFLSCVVLMAGLTMRPWAVAAALGACLAFLLLVLAPAAAAPQPSAAPQAMVGYGVLLCLIAALVALVGNITSTRALEAASQAHRQAEQAAAERDQLNADLESQVRERTAALERALQEVERRAAQQAALLEEVGLQRVAIRELSVPVLPVDRSTLVLPLVGALDSARLRDLQERALSAIQEAGARRLILDVTGTPVVDTQVAQGLVAIVQGARLLGADVVLVGMRPEVAQTIVSLGLDISGIQTFRDLHAALDRGRSLRERVALS
jgi:rsbT co-antagonist protein RsbR